MQALGAALISTNAASLVADLLEPDDWIYGPHRKIQAAIRSLLGRELAANIETTAAELRRLGTLEDAGGTEYLWKLHNACLLTQDCGTYLKVIQEKADLRRLIVAGQQIVGLGYDDGLTGPEGYAAAEAALYQAQRRRKGQAEFVTAAELSNELLDVFEEGDPPGIRTGYGPLDWAFGGWQDTLLYLVAGRAASGKTAALLNFILKILQAGEPVGFLSLEMSRKQVGRRLLSILSGVHGKHIARRQMDADEAERVARANGQLSALPLYICDQRELSLLGMRGHAARLKRQQGIKVLCLDYLQLILPDRGEADVRHFTQVAEGLKSAARDLEIPVIALSQLNRKTDDESNKRPLLSHLRESGGLEQAADVVLMLYRENYYRRQKGEVIPGPDETEFILAKNREDEPGKAVLWFEGETMRFLERDGLHSETDAPPSRNGNRPHYAEEF
jgi:replicative DNA helicase